MKAIILAAGYAKRMRPLTDANHKTLLQIGDASIIERIVNSLLENGITDIAIVTGFLKQQLSEFLLNTYPDVQFTFVHNAEFDRTNNIYSMALAFEQLEIDQDVLLIESDLIYHADIIRELIDDPRENIALVDRYRQGMDGTVVTVENDIITDVIPPHRQSANFDFSDKYKTLNIYKFSRNFAANEFKRLLTYYARTIDNNCYYELILGMLIYMQRQEIHALGVAGNTWAEVDDPNDLAAAQFLFEEDKQKEMLDRAFGGFWNYDIVDFCFIRNMYFPSGSVLSELRNNMENLLWNYGSNQRILDQKLAYYRLCSVDNIVALNGAAAIYPVLKQYFQGKSGTIPNPTFGEYYSLFDTVETYSDNGIAEVCPQQMNSVNSDVVVFVNPNNPTGTEIDDTKILSFARENPEKQVVVDESFIEFSRYDSLIPALEQSPCDNIIIVKSLSKSLGLPGIRLGYVYSTNTAFVNFVKNHLPIWSMNSMAEFFMEVLLKHRGSITQSISDTIRDREDFANRLSEVPMVSSVLHSGANFIACRLNISHASLEELRNTLLLEHRLYVKDISSKFDEGVYIRLAVRLPQENRRLTDVLGAIREDPEHSEIQPSVSSFEK